MIITTHAKQRAKERLGVSRYQDRNKLFKNALQKGHPMNDFEGEMYDYIADIKSRNHSNEGVKIYENTVFIYKGKTILTCYPVPNYLLPINQYLKRKKKVIK